MKGAVLAALVALLVPSAALALETGAAGDAAYDDPRPLYMNPSEPAQERPAMPGPEDPVPTSKAAPGGLKEALEAANAITAAHAGGDYSVPDYPIVGARVDERDGRLVVTMHAMAYLAGMEYTPDEIREALSSGVDVEVTYDAFDSGVWVPGGSRESRVALEARYYLDSCLPLPRPGLRASCVEYAEHLGTGYPARLPPGELAPSHILLSDDFELGLEVNWLQSGTGWDVGSPGHGLDRQGGTGSDLAATSGACVDACTLMQRAPVYLPYDSSPELVFRAHVGPMLLPGEYLRVQVFASGEWTMLHEWGEGDGGHDGWVVARSDLAFLVQEEARLRFVAKTHGPPGSISIDDVAIRGLGTPRGSLPDPHGLPPSGILASALTGDELGLLADDMAALYRMAAESAIMRSVLSLDVRHTIVDPRDPEYPDVLFSEGFESGLAKNWVSEGDDGWAAPHLATWYDMLTLFPTGMAATATSCEGVCTITLRAPVDLSGHSMPHLYYGAYADSLLPGEYLRVETYETGAPVEPAYGLLYKGVWNTISDVGENDPNAIGHWYGTFTSLLSKGEDGDGVRIRFVTNVSGPEGRVAIDNVEIRGIKGVLPDDYAPTHGDLAPERLGSAELKRAALNLDSLYRLAMTGNAMRSHLPQDIQEEMGFGPFEYRYDRCHLSDCPDARFRAHGWDYESYLRSESLDLTDLCRGKYDSLLSGLGWVDAGAYWGEFLHLCNRWQDADRVVEAFTRTLTDGLGESCAAQVADGWRLGTSGWLYPPGWPTASGGGVPLVWALTSGWIYPPGWDPGHFEPGQLADECLPGRGGFGEFLLEWDRGLAGT